MDVLSVVVPLPARDRLVRSTCLEVAQVARALVWDGIIESYEIVLVDGGVPQRTAESAEVLAQRDKHVRVVRPDVEAPSDPIREALPEAHGAIIACIREDVRSGSELLKDAIRTMRTTHADVVSSSSSIDSSGFVLIRKRAVGRLGRFGASPRRSVKVVRIDESGEEVQSKNPALVLLRQRAVIASGTAAAAIAAVLALVFVGLAPEHGGTGRASVDVAVAPAARAERVARADPPDNVARHGAQFSQFSEDLAALPLASEPSKRSVRVQPVPSPTTRFVSEADPTCGTDATMQLQREIDSLPEHGALDLLEGGCYTTSAPIVLRSADGVTLDGKGATLRFGGISCDDANRARISNLHLATRSAGRAALIIDNCTGVEVADLSIHAAGSGIEIGHGASDVAVHGVEIESGKEAVIVRSGSHLSFTGLRTKSGRRSALLLEGSKGDKIQGIAFSGSTLSTDGNALEAAGQASIADVAFYSNRLLGGRQRIIVDTKGVLSRGWIIYGNRSDTIEDFGAYLIFDNARDVAIVRNVFRADKVILRAAVRFSDASGDLSILENDFTGACRVYATDRDTTEVKAKDNRVSDC